MRMGLPQGAVAVAVDDVRHSSAALVWGAEQARREDRPLVVVHAAGHLAPGLSYADRHRQRPALLQSGDRVLEDAARLLARTAPGLATERLVRLVDAGAFLLDLRSETHLVVVGPETWAATAGDVLTAAEPALGSSVAWMPGPALAPVVVVGRNLPVPSTEHVLAATASSVAPADVLDFAFDTASGRGGDLEVVVRRDRRPLGHADPHPPASDGQPVLPLDPTADVARCLERLRAEDGAIPAEVTISTPGNRYLLGRSAHASLAVLGRAHVGPSSAGTRDLGLRLVQRMRCPVAVVT